MAPRIFFRKFLASEIILWEFLASEIFGNFGNCLLMEFFGGGRNFLAPRIFFRKFLASEIFLWEFLAL